MTDIQAAAQAYWRGDGCLWEFAEKATALAGKNGATDELARMIRRSVDTVQGYVAGYLLWVQANNYLKVGCPVDAETLRESLSVQIFVTIGRKWKNRWFDDDPVKNTEQALNLLIEAHQLKWTVEQTRSHVPHNSQEPDFSTSCLRLSKRLDYEIINAPALNVEPEYYGLIRTKAIEFRTVLDAGSYEAAVAALEAG